MSSRSVSEQPPRDPPAPPAPVVRGRIERVLRERGFGFIKVLEGEYNGTNIFFHASSLLDGGFQTIEEGRPVTFELKVVPKGPRAERITVAE